MNRISSVSLSLALAFSTVLSMLGIASTAFAADLTSGATASVGAAASGSGMTGMTSSSNTGNAQTGVSTGVSGTVSNSATGNSGTTSVSGSVNTSVSAQGTANTGATATGNGTSNGSASSLFSLTRSDVNETSNTSASGSDLKSHIVSTMRSDENLTDVSTTNDGMDIKYNQSAHFLGFIPAHINTRIHIAADGMATVSYPWYSFLMSDYRSSSELEGSLNMDASANGSWQTRFDHIEAAMSGNSSTSSDTSAGTNAGTNTSGTNMASSTGTMASSTS